MPTPKKPLVSASILSCNLLRMEDEIRDAQTCGVDWHHVDVMDGHFVPNLTFGLPFIQALKKISTIPLDVHLMITNPDAVISQYLDAGADCLSFHFEAAKHPHKLLRQIRSAGRKAGLAINPGTGVGILEDLLCEVDFILVMSVNPGFSGQSFISNSLKKIEALSAIRARLGLTDAMHISVDGGVDVHNAKDLVECGASILVSGSTFYGAQDRKRAVKLLKGT